jgi:DNA-binding transcriptional LysR family regulator
MIDEQQRELGHWADELAPFVSVTIDQLRTYIAVHETGSTRAAALRVLKRDQSSVEKQLKTLDDHFWNFNKERLIIKPPGRGAELRFTRGGERVYELAQKVLHEFQTTRTHLEKVYRIRIATTKFTIPLLAEIDDPIWKRLKQNGRQPERELIHIRSEQVQRCLDDPTIDFSLGGMISRQQIDPKVDFIRWNTEKFVLLSNFPLPSNKIHIKQLRSLDLPLVLRTDGVMREFVNLALGGSDGLNAVEWCNDLQFALDLLRLRVHEACMICTEFIASEAAKRIDSAGVLHAYPLVDCDLRHDRGLFRRTGADKLYEPTHPVRIFWDTFKELALKRAEGAKNRRAK